MISIHSSLTEQSSACKAVEVPVAGGPASRASGEVYVDAAPGAIETLVKVRMATTDAEKEEIYRLRYQVYIEEMDGEQRHVEVDVAARQLRDEWDERASHFYIREDGIVVACA